MSQLMLVNPRRRRRATTKRKTKRPVARRVSARRSPVKRKRNPIKRRSMASRNSKGMMQSHIMPAFTSAVGALGLDVVTGFVPLPAFASTGPLRYVIKGAGAIGLGIVAGMFVKKSTANQLAAGALTVTMHEAMKEATSIMAPSIPLGYYGAGINAGQLPPGYQDSGVGYYVSHGPSQPSAEERENAQMGEYIS